MGDGLEEAVLVAELIELVVAVTRTCGAASVTSALSQQSYWARVPEAQQKVVKASSQAQRYARSLEEAAKSQTESGSSWVVKGRLHTALAFAQATAVVLICAGLNLVQACVIVPVRRQGAVRMIVDIATKAIRHAGVTSVAAPFLCATLDGIYCR